MVEYGRVFRMIDLSILVPLPDRKHLRMLDSPMHSVDRAVGGASPPGALRPTEPALGRLHEGRAKGSLKIQSYRTSGTVRLGPRNLHNECLQSPYLRFGPTGSRDGPSRTRPSGRPAGR